MKGAREYASLFKTGQYGKLWLEVDSHARGKTFRIFVLESDKPTQDLYKAKHVEVYGVISGQSGWTEEYGWLHKGPWQDDFYALVDKTKAEIEAAEIERQLRKEERERKEKEAIMSFLARC